MPVFPLPDEFVRLAPNSTAAWLLRHIVFRLKKARIRFDGHLWFALPYSMWAEQTGLSVRQVRRSFQALRDNGLIETEQHLYGVPAKNILHVRLASTLTSDREVGVPEKGLPELPEKGQPKLPEKGQLYYLEKEVKKEVKKESAEHTIRDSGAFMNSGKKEKAKRVSDVLRKSNEQATDHASPEALLKAMNRAEEDPSTKRLATLFTHAWAVGGYGFRPPLIQKETKQLRDIIDACESVEVGVYLIAEATSQWELLSAHLKQSMKSSSPPKYPVPGYILASKVAVLEWLQSRVDDEQEVSTLTPGVAADWSNL